MTKIKDIIYPSKTRVDEMTKTIITNHRPTYRGVSAGAPGPMSLNK